HHATWLKYGDANIAEYDIRKLCQDQYRALEQLAFEGLKTRQLIFTPQLIEELEIETDILENVKKIGLVKAIGDDGKRVNNKERYFIHLTFQEYFAARYIVGLLAHLDPAEHKKGADFIREYKYSLFYERVIWFIAGLLSEKGKDALQTKFWHILLNEQQDLALVRHDTLVIRCLEEAGLNDRIPGCDRITQQIKERILSYIRNQLLDDDSKVLDALASSKKFMTQTQLIKNLLREPNKRYIFDILSEIKIRDEDLTQQAIAEIRQNPDKNVKYSAADALGKMATSDQQAIQALLTMLHDKEEDVRETAVNALGNIATNDQQTIYAILALLHAKEANVRIAAVFALRKIAPNNQQVTQALPSLLYDQKAVIREIAIQTLSEIAPNDQQIIQALLLLLHDK
ncbi:MAG: HEAT repeat domain-containing protein, partial [Burkholderiales bacterium]